MTVVLWRDVVLSVTSGIGFGQKHTRPESSDRKSVFATL